MIDRSELDQEPNEDQHRALVNSSRVNIGQVDAAHDETERKRAEEALRESEARFRAAFESAAVGMSQAGLDGRLQLVNPRLCEILGYPERELVGLSYESITHPDDVEESRETIRKLVGGAIPTLYIEKRYVHRDGHSVWVRVSGSVVRGDAGEPLYVLIIVQDMTSQHAAQDELRRSEERFRAIFEQAAVGIGVVGLNGRYLRANRKLCSILGRDERELSGLRFEEITHAEDVARNLHLARDLFSGRSDSFQYEKRYLRPDGSSVWVLVTVSMVRDGEGNPLYAIGMVEDVSVRKRAEAALEESQQELRQAQKLEAIGRLAGGIAHDFNNLLGVILGNAELALRRVGEAEGIRRELSEIGLASDRAAVLTRQLLAFSRKQVLQPVTLNVSVVVAETAQMIRRLIGEHIEMVLDLDTIPAFAVVDRAQLNVVLLNLAVNARDAMPQEGVLRITTRVTRPGRVPRLGRPQPGDGGFVRVSVRDTGRGIAPEIRERIFEPFFTTKAPGEGTGLGLSTVYGFVQQSGGTIECDSVVGSGTTFHIYLPLADPGPSGVTEPARKQTPSRPGGTVLLVEDEEALREVTRRMLQQGGFTVLEAGAGAEALKLAARFRGPIDLLLTDVVMPGMGGIELAKRLGDARPTLRILFMSGYPLDAIPDHGSLDGGPVLIQKPFTAAEIVDRVCRLLAPDRPS